jgi:hypothetical protein
MVKDPNKSSKYYVNGIELVPSLTFNGWQAGFEYTKNLTFKNLNTKTVKITYKYALEYSRFKQCLSFSQKIVKA